jgi:hypothetical protein
MSDFGEYFFSHLFSWWGPDVTGHRRRTIFIIILTVICIGVAIGDFSWKTVGLLSAISVALWIALALVYSAFNAFSQYRDR